MVRGNRVRAELVSREKKKRSLSIATDTNDILNGYSSNRQYAPEPTPGHTTRPTAPVLRLAARSLGVYKSEADIDDPGT